MQWNTWWDGWLGIYEYIDAIGIYVLWRCLQYAMGWFWNSYIYTGGYIPTWTVLSIFFPD